jgi:hypothetical protein
MSLTYLVPLEDLRLHGVQGLGSFFSLNLLIDIARKAFILTRCG